MDVVEAGNAIEYLRRRGLLSPEEAADAVPLAWGVSNVVIRIRRRSGPDWVLKQSREQLRTKQLWVSRLDRIYREVEALQVCGELLGPEVVPTVIDEDRSNYLFLMSAAPADHKVWKEQLLAGEIDPAIAERLGTILARLHRLTAGRSDLAEQWNDLTVFDELRIDPFYRRVAAARPEMTDRLQELIAEMSRTRVSLVHADFSPKNVLIHDPGLTLVDYETAHWGDPAFDLGFFLSHLLLKAIKHRARLSAFRTLTDRFWSAYWQELGRSELEPTMQSPQLLIRGQKHLAACLWSRIDGKSTIDYLPLEEEQQAARTFARKLLIQPDRTWAETWQELEQAIGRAGLTSETADRKPASRC